MRRESERTEYDEHAVLGRVNVRRLDVDLARVGAGVGQRQATNDEHVGGQVADHLPLDAVLLIAVHDLVDDVVELDAVVARQHPTALVVDPLHLHSVTDNIIIALTHR